jgi:hypothetical protein
MRKGSWGQSPKGWIDLGSDLCWEDHGGTWAKRDKHSASKRAYYVLRFSNLTEEMRKRDEDRPYYEAATAWIDLDDGHDDEINSALRSCGYTWQGEAIINEWDGAIVASDSRTRDYVILSALAGYGLDWDFQTSDKRPRNLRAQAARSC